MKKLTLLLSLVLSTTISSAQTLEAPFIIAGDAFTYTITDTVAPGEAGENMVWNYLNLGFVQNYNGQFLPAAQSPNQDDYPYAEWILEMAGGQYYHNFGPEMYEYFGGVENGTSYPYLDSEEYYPYPYNYGETHQDSAINTMNIMGMETLRSTYISTTFDGYGVLNMPNETSYNDVCRIKVHRELTDSTIAGITNIIIDQILFFQNGIATPIVAHADIWEYNGTTWVEVYNVMEYLQNYTVGADEIETSLFAMCPNPSSDLVTLRWAACAESITVYDAMGRKVETINAIPGLNLAQFDVSDWSPGVYTISFFSGDAVTSKHLVVE